MKNLKNFQQFNESREDGPRDFDGEMDSNSRINQLANLISAKQKHADNQYRSEDASRVEKEISDLQEKYKKLTGSYYDSEQDFKIHHNDLNQFETEYATYTKNEEDEWSIVLKYNGQEFGPSFEHPLMDSWDTVSQEDERKLKEIRSNVTSLLKENNLTDLKLLLDELPVDQLFGAAMYNGWDYESFDENPETAVSVVATLVIAKIDLYFKIILPY